MTACDSSSGTACCQRQNVCLCFVLFGWLFVVRGGVAWHCLGMLVLCGSLGWCFCAAVGCNQLFFCCCGWSIQLHATTHDYNTKSNNTQVQHTTTTPPAQLQHRQHNCNTATTTTHSHTKLHTTTTTQLHTTTQQLHRQTTPPHLAEEPQQLGRHLGLRLADRDRLDQRLHDVGARERLALVVLAR